jgi:hypothetical protein
MTLWCWGEIETGVFLTHDTTVRKSFFFFFGRIFAMRKQSSVKMVTVKPIQSVASVGSG